MVRTKIRTWSGYSALAVIFLGLVLGTNAATAELAAKADFIELEPIDFSFQREGPKLKFRSSKARIFYSFQPADPDKNPAQMPLFVFFNGGPGCPTCDGLLSTNTGPRSIYPIPWGPTAWRDSSSQNEHSWTRLGNLLYIDAPTTGFSYNIAEVPPGASNAHLYDAQNYNPYIDAAQMVRVLLRFLSADANKELRENPVVLVGESYGGTRVSIMLNMLLNYRRYESGADVYADPELTRVVQSYLDVQRSAALSGRVHAPASIAQQFGRQILIQPQLTGRYQSEITGTLYEAPDSVIYQLAKEEGKIFTPCLFGSDPGDSKKCDPAENAIRFVIYGLDLSPYDSRRPMKGKWPPEWLSSEAFLTVWMMWHFLFAGPPSEVAGFPLANVAYLKVANRSGINAKTGHRWYAYDRKLPPDPWIETSDLVEIPPTMRPWFEALPEVIAHGEALIADQEDIAATWGQDLFTAFGRPVDVDKDSIYRTCPPMDVYYAFYKNSAIRTEEHPDRYDISPESIRYGRLFLENLAQVKTMITNARRDLVIYSPALAPSLARYTDLVQTAVTSHPCADAQCDGTIEVNFKPTGTRLRTVSPGLRTIRFPYYDRSGHSVAAGMPEKLLSDVGAWMTEP